MACDTPPCIADENGTPYPFGVDADGNACIIVPSGKPKPGLYDQSKGEIPPADCCKGVNDYGAYAIDTSTNVVTHLCAGDLGWLPFFTTAPPDPVGEVCYDTTGVSWPLTYGGPSTNWTTPSGVRLNTTTCQGGTGDVINTPRLVESSCDFTSSVCGAVPPNPTGMTWTDTGSLAVEGSGDPADGWACTRPALQVSFGLPATSVGPFTVSFTATTEGCLNVLLYNTATGQYLPVQTGTGNGYVAGGGKAWAMRALSGSTERVTFQTVPGLTGDKVRVHVTAVGNYGSGSNSTERLANMTLAAGGAATSGGDCCRQVATLNELAALLTAADPEATWVPDGNRLCATVPATKTSSYGPIQFCQQTLYPEGTAPPPTPTFTTTPATSSCYSTESGSLCWDCSNGEITKFQYRAAGSNGGWTDAN